MIPLNSHRFMLVLAITLAALGGFARPGTAQQMVISVYADTAPVDDGEFGSTISAYVSVVDNSWGCSHGDYYTNAWLSSPSRIGFDQEPGLSGFPSLDFDFELGEWNAGATVTFYCDCAAGYVGGGGAGSQIVPVGTAFRHHYYRIPSSGPYLYILNDDSQDRACSHTQMSWGQDHSAGITDEGFYYTWLNMPAGCLAQCSGGQWGSVIGPGGTTLRAATCG
jgi:hypothetical protein